MFPINSILKLFANKTSACGECLVLSLKIDLLHWSQEASKLKKEYLCVRVKFNLVSFNFQ